MPRITIHNRDINRDNDIEFFQWLRLYNLKLNVEIFAGNLSFILTSPYETFPTYKPEPFNYFTLPVNFPTSAANKPLRSDTFTLDDYKRFLSIYIGTYLSNKTWHLVTTEGQAQNRSYRIWLDLDSFESNWLYLQDND